MSNIFSTEQLKAIEAKGGALVSAGAGSGKTAVLIEHLVTWIKNLPSFKTTHEYQLVIDLKSLVVITFTVKASQEMKMRLFERIHSLQQSEVESWKIVKKHINNIYIGTIDGFCAKIINKNLPTLNLSVPFDIVSNQEWEDKIQGLYNAWSSSLINQDDITISKIWHKKILDWLISVLASTSSRLAWQKFSTLEVNAEKFIVENTNILNKLFEEHNWSENISQLVASLDSLNSSDCQSKTWYQFLCKLKLKTQSRINLESVEIVSELLSEFKGMKVPSSEEFTHIAQGINKLRNFIKDHSTIFNDWQLCLKQSAENSWAGLFKIFQSLINYVEENYGRCKVFVFQT